MLASLIHEFLDPVEIIHLCETFEFIPGIDWQYDLAIYTGKMITMPIPGNKKDKGSNTNNLDDTDEDGTGFKKPVAVQRYLYNVPYLFSKVESRRIFDLIISRVTKAVEKQVAHIPYKFRNDEERTHFENLLILQAAIKDLPALAEQQKLSKNNKPRKIFKPNLQAHVRSPGRSPMMSSKHSRSPTLSGKI